MIFTGGIQGGWSPVLFCFTTEKRRGACIEQAERKALPSTLIPDVDNAAVGNDFTLLQEDTTKGILLFFHTFEKGEAD